ncbi:MAG TPA: hypothetical protein VNK47_05905 [Candidatus Dormibacteraeota bacterium]|jgi:hypothetical protein|nr:hypothetical protein [Candidatus Dormibacteraeota bacterium]
MKIRSLVLALSAVATLTFALPSLAQERPAPTPAQAAIPAANPKDVESIDAIMAALYGVISGPAGERDWNRFRSLFLPEARMGAARKKPDGTFTAATFTPDGYVERAGNYFKEHAFFESEVSRKTEQFGQEAHVFSTYESRNAKDEKPFARGINSLQLFNDGKRWYVVSIFWDEERADNPLPQKYLTK